MNLEEEKLKLEQEKQGKLDNYNNTYDSLLNERNDLVNQQNQLVDQYTQTQTNLANDQLNYQKDLLQQEKDKANESFQKEAKASYTDYQDFINPYGVEREKQVQNGLSNSGYSETSKVNAYNTHQNRVAVARASLKDAQLQYDNEFRKAELANNSTLAELALNQLQQKIELIMSNFEYKDTITQNKFSYQNTIDNEYYNKYQNVLSQINYEKEQEEAIRQYQEKMEYQKQQDAISQSQWEKQFAYQQEQDKISNNLSLASLNAKTQTETTGDLGDLGDDPSPTNFLKFDTSKSPRLSSKEAQNWYYENIEKNAYANGGMNEHDYEELMNTAIDNKLINETDINRIAKLFGL